MNVSVLGMGLVAPSLSDEFRIRVLPQLDDPRVKRMPRLEHMALAAAREALAPGADLKNLAVVFGTGYGGLRATTDFLDGMSTRGAEFGSPIAFQQSVHHSPAGQISIMLGSHGASLTMSSRELSGESALQVAITLLSTGRAEEVLVVAADEWTPTLDAGYRAFETSAGDDAGQSDCFVRASEGAAALLLAKRPGSLMLETCTLTAHCCPILRFASRDQMRPLLLEGARGRGGTVSFSLAAPNPAVLEAETSILSELAVAPAQWVDTDSFGFHPSVGLLRIVLAATRVQKGPGRSACAVHGLALGGGQSLTVVRHVES